MDLRTLESIALEVRDEIFNDESIQYSDRSTLRGACCSADDMVIEKLKEIGVEDINIVWIKINESDESHRHHRLVIIGSTFEDSYRIDPTISQFGIKRFVFIPGEQYPLDYKVTSQYPR